ncbi:MAG TPA: hypothetical protein VF841_18090 [Anaeromyxobacter sp.]
MPHIRPFVACVAALAVACSGSSKKSGPAPALTAVSAPAICTSGGALILSGSNFKSGAGVTLTGGGSTASATGVTVSADGTQATALFGTGLPVGGPYDVAIRNPDGQSATLAAAVRVVARPQIFYVDPSVVWNGIAVQASVYGTGFNEPVRSVSLVPSGGGTGLPLAFTEATSRPDQVQVVIPAGTTSGIYDVQVQDAYCSGSLANAVTVTHTAALGLGALSPAEGWTGSTTGVSLAAVGGSSFLPVPRAYLNPSTPGAGAIAGALGAVALVDSTDLTAEVPAGLPPGSYDLIVVNPDGSVGVSPGAFQVLADPPPTIAGLSPGALPNTSAATFHVLGANFRSAPSLPAVTLTCADATGAVTAAPLVTVLSVNAAGTDLTASVNASGTTAAACAVQVTNADQSFGVYSALVFTNPAQNLFPPIAGPSLSVARRAPVALGGDATSAARFLHVVGGDDGAGTELATVETAPLSLLGTPGPFQTQRSRLNQARTLAGGARIGRFLYVAGGSSAGAALATVERAAVLDPADRGTIAGVVLAIDGSTPRRGLAPGLWYYRVAAVLDGTDPVNPLGENLPSDPFPVQLPDLGGPRFDVTVTWRPVAHAARYRVYRSPTAGAAVGTEQVFAEVPAPATSFVDFGDGAAVSTDTPLPVGSLGAWTTLAATLATPREGPGVAWGLDPVDSTRAYLYVIGGRSSASSALSSIELLPITLQADGTQTPDAAFVQASGSGLSAARWQLGASSATSDQSANIPAGTTYVYALSGLSASGALVSSCDAFQVTPGGQPGTITALPQLHRAGYGTAIAAGFVFAFGGAQGLPGTTIDSGQIDLSPPHILNFNAEGVSMLQARYLPGGALSGAFVYLAGGVNVASPLALTATTEYFLW